MAASGSLRRLAHTVGRAALACAAGALIAVSIARAQAGGDQITPNFQDADIGKIADAVAMATHKNFIIDPRVRANVTLIATTPMSADAFYQTFLAILQVHGFIAVQAGPVIKIVPDANQRYYPSNDLPDHVSSTSDEIVTQVIQLKNVSAAQLVPVLRPLVPQQGQLAAYPPSNILVISDHAANVNRIMRIIGRVDQAGDADIEVLTMQNASATEVARVVNSLYQAQGQAAEAGGQPLKIVADERSNSILVSGEPAARLRVRTIITHLDTPLRAGGETQVRYLRYADAEKLAPKLKQQLTGIAQAAGGGTGGAAGQNASAQAERGADVWADPQNNALVITAPAKTMRSLMAIIDQLDIRRAQVLVEAIIVDVSLDKSAELGVNWAVFSKDSKNNSIPGATFLTPVGGASLVDLANAIQNPANINPALENGTTVAVGRIASTGLSFAAMLRALRSDDNSNIIATPSAVTMDHQEAQIKIAQEVPFVTGQYASTGTTTTTGAVTPFQTIQREEVGTILKLTPQINEGNAVILKIELESSSVVPKSAGPQGAVDLTTNKRTVSTNVLIEDGGIIVLGGLISTEYDRTETGVPYLSRIPLLGELFKDHTASHQKKDLMIFIRPQILKDGTDTAIETNSKYNFIREEQHEVGAADQYSIPLLPGTKSPLLPQAPPPPPEGSTSKAPVTLGEKERAAEQGRALQEQGQAPPQTAPGTAPQATPAPSPVAPPAPSPQAAPTQPPGKPQ